MFRRAPPRPDAARPLFARAGLLAVLALLAACSDHVAPSVDEKTRLTAELIDARPACLTFTQQLSGPAADAASLRGVYEAAKAAHCLKPDV